MDFVRNNFRAIGITIVVLIVGLIIYVLSVSVSRNGKVAVTVDTFPRNAKILLNGSQAVNNGVTYLKPGNYQVDVSADGFKSSSETQTIDANRTTIAVVLTPESDAAKTLMKKNDADYKKVEAKVGTRSAQDSNLFFDTNPITKHLPLKDRYFSIGYYAPDGVHAIVTINTESPQFRYYAIKQIQNWGYDVTDLNIKYTDFKNPLGN